MIVNNLSGKKIKDLTYGYCHYIARNAEKTYCCGNNSWAQLGNGKRNDDYQLIVQLIDVWTNNIDKSLNRNILYCDRFFFKRDKRDIEVILEDAEVSDIKCGFSHTLALTKGGKVYAWGCNINGQIGIASEELFQIKPIILNSFDDEKIVEISCGFHHSMALAKSGIVFSWGYNSWGQLGIGNILNSNKPEQIKFDKNDEQIFIKSISCGRRHSLLLSSKGIIYACGNNECGQLGIPNTDPQLSPIQLNFGIKFKEIASHFDTDISVSLSYENKFYVWGEWKEF
jgi:alpha-tubulin suppressor-like RCC1 family protein